MDKTSGFTNKEVFEAVNNAVQRMLHSNALGIPAELRLKRLRSYADALLELPIQHVEEGQIKGEELAASLLCGSLYIWRRYVEKSMKAPTGMVGPATVMVTADRDEGKRKK